MKPRKIRRRSGGRRRSSFARRSTFPWKNVLTVVLLLALAAGGAFTAKWLFEQSPEAVPSEPTTTESTSAPTTVPDDPVTQPTVSDVPSLPTAQTARAVYVSTTLLADETALEKQLDEMVAAGFNAITFDLKDADGQVWYQSATASAKTAKSVAETALTSDRLRAVLELCEEKGVLAMPRLYAFRDKLGAMEMPAARVLYSGDPSVMWLDGRVGVGRPWLNPYAESAQTYITDLISELKGYGFTTLLLDGVQFPDQRWYASYGSTAQVSPDVLRKFVSLARTAFGDGELVLCTPALAALGSDTAAFGDNPLTFGATTVSPSLLPSSLGSNLTVGGKTLKDPSAQAGEAVRLVYEQIRSRTKLLENDAPALLPWIEADGYTTAEIQAQIAAVTDENGTASFVLYSAAASYDFGALQ